MDLGHALAAVMEHLKELEVSARKLDNQNFGDLIAGARGKLLQAAEHADLEKVGEQLTADLHAGQEGFPFNAPQSDGA